ncbi:uncharacterized protein LOC101864652 isoform X2 [Aplysia californica]|uniref:Uncharacterized protein LOC101864652 isoform X2 n=1 Tax=Aplysia californica TaxID=6500 RepID=A0ABM1ABY1_APLCA|nr:uncharacterized protein LOC101864652 isoform X2 [Aplysia californica]
MGSIDFLKRCLLRCRSGDNDRHNNNNDNDGNIFVDVPSFGHTVKELFKFLEVRSYLYIAFRMFSSALRDVFLVDGFSTLPLIFVLYIILTTHACIIYTCNLNGRTAKADVAFIVMVILAEVLVAGCGLIFQSVDLLLELIAFAGLQRRRRCLEELVSPKRTSQGG